MSILTVNFNSLISEVLGSSTFFLIKSKGFKIGIFLLYIMVEGNSVKTAFIAAGGSKKIKGQPKAFIDVDGKPSVEHVVDAVLGSGIENVYVWTNECARLEKILKGKEGNICVVEAQKKAIKTIGDLKIAVKQALNSEEKTLLIAIYNNQNQRRYIGIKLD